MFQVGRPVRERDGDLVAGEGDAWFSEMDARTALDRWGDRRSDGSTVYRSLLGVASREGVFLVAFVPLPELSARNKFLETFGADIERERGDFLDVAQWREKYGTP